MYLVFIHLGGGSTGPRQFDRVTCRTTAHQVHHLCRLHRINHIRPRHLRKLSYLLPFSIKRPDSSSNLLPITHTRQICHINSTAFDSFRVTAILHFYVLPVPTHHFNMELTVVVLMGGGVLVCTRIALGPVDLKGAFVAVFENRSGIAEIAFGFHLEVV